MSTAIELTLMPATKDVPKDSELAERCSAGDDQAMQILYERHGRRLYLLSLRLTGSSADAEEVVQETFLKAWRHIDGFRSDSSLATWLFRISLNLCRDRSRRKQHFYQEMEVQVPVKEPDTFARQNLAKALDRLSNGYREVLVMHDVLEMHHSQIAELLGIAVGTSKSQLHKARAQMRGLLRASGVAQGD